MSANVKAVLATVLVVLLLGGAFVLGRSSLQPQVDAASRRADRLSASLQTTQKELATTKDDLDSTKSDLDSAQSQLADANATLAACDADKASEVFDDLMSEYGSFLTQYSDYLDNSDLYFFIDWNALDRGVRGHYSGRNSMQDQFDAALAACTTGSGANA